MYCAIRNQYFSVAFFYRKLLDGGRLDFYPYIVKLSSPDFSDGEVFERFNLLL